MLMMEKMIFIVTGGELGDPAFLRDKVEAIKPAALICVDRGARHLQAAGIFPTLIVGDMDSLDGESARRYEAMGCRFIRHPREKDETDTELALREAFRIAPSEVWIWGAMGYRIDHTLANLSLLVQGAEQGVAVKLVDEWCEVFLVTRRTVLEGEAGQTVSLLPFSGDVTGVTLTGFEYPLTQAVLAVGHPRGTSNRLVAGRGVIEINAGYLLVVRYFRPGEFPGEVTR
jgi:thiamine pyrophosphokinase